MCKIPPHIRQTAFAVTASLKEKGDLTHGTDPKPFQSIFLHGRMSIITVKTYLIDALGAMAFGLFASLLIGTIFATLGEKSGIEIFTTISDYAKSATGAALGVSIAYALKAPQLVLFSAATVGIAGNALGGPGWRSDSNRCGNGTW